MNNKKIKRIATGNVILGYILMSLFVILIVMNRPGATVVTGDDEIVAAAKDLPVLDLDIPAEVVYTDPKLVPDILYIDRGHGTGRVYNDRLEEYILPDPVYVDTDIVHDTERIDVNLNERYTKINRQHNRFIDADGRVLNSHIDDDRHGSIDREAISVYGGSGGDHRAVDRHRDVDFNINDHDLLTARLLEEKVIDDEVDIGINARDRNTDLSKLTVDRDEDSDELELGELDLQFDQATGYGTGKGGELYAYNYPSQGVGAGIGSGSLGAGAGGSAGLGAGIGEAVLAGKTVPTLGGVGTYAPPGASGGGAPAAGAPAAGGVGGLVGGAGAGGAAGLITGMVKDVLGVGPGSGSGVGGGRGKYNYDHLPKDGELHIMMHVDGSGSILNTRKQLDIMKDTLLKTALLPYYKNDEALYNSRVTIVDGSGERSLQFFTDAAKKDNVLAIAFQDEAQPVYHLPTFNKKPGDEYIKDLTNLKASLNGYGGLYRGVMFQVDRGRTFAKSFKEFVECAWRGEGYLETANLKRYYRDNNTQHIKNKDGIVFSDEYHANDAGTPQYYLDLILDASKRVGIDLNITGGGLTDGKRVLVVE